MKTLLIGFISFMVLYGCSTPYEAGAARTGAMQNRYIAEQARIDGNEALARIHEGHAKRKSDSMSLLGFIIKEAID